MAKRKVSRPASQTDLGTGALYSQNEKSKNSPYSDDDKKFPFLKRQKIEKSQLFNSDKDSGINGFLSGNDSIITPPGSPFGESKAASHQSPYNHTHLKFNSGIQASGLRNYDRKVISATQAPPSPASSPVPVTISSIPQSRAGTDSRSFDTDHIKKFMSNVASQTPNNAIYMRMVIQALTNLHHQQRQQLEAAGKLAENSSSNSASTKVSNSAQNTYLAPEESKSFDGKALNKSFLNSVALLNQYAARYQAYRNSSGNRVYCQPNSYNHKQHTFADQSKREFTGQNSSRLNASGQVASIPLNETHRLSIAPSANYESNSDHTDLEIGSKVVSTKKLQKTSDNPISPNLTISNTLLQPCSSFSRTIDTPHRSEKQKPVSNGVSSEKNNVKIVKRRLRQKNPALAQLTADISEQRVVRRFPLRTSKEVLTRLMECFLSFSSCIDKIPQNHSRISLRSFWLKARDGLSDSSGLDASIAKKDELPNNESKVSHATEAFSAIEKINRLRVKLQNRLSNLLGKSSISMEDINKVLADQESEIPNSEELLEQYVNKLLEKIKVLFGKKDSNFFDHNIHANNSAAMSNSAQNQVFDLDISIDNSLKEDSLSAEELIHLKPELWKKISYNLSKKFRWFPVSSTGDSENEISSTIPKIPENSKFIRKIHGKSFSKSDKFEKLLFKDDGNLKNSSWNNLLKSIRSRAPSKSKFNSPDVIEYYNLCPSSLSQNDLLQISDLISRNLYPMSPDEIHNELKSISMNNLIVAKVGWKIIGLTVLDEGMGQARYLSYWVVDERWRGCSIGKIMMFLLLEKDWIKQESEKGDDTEDIALKTRSNTKKDVLLHVNPLNYSAISVYSLFGFKIEAYIVGYYDKYYVWEETQKSTRGKRNALLMRKRWI